MSKYLVSFGDSDKYEVEFPGTLSQFKDSDELKSLKDKVEEYVKEKFPMGGFKDMLPLHIEESDGKDYPKLDMSNLKDMLQNLLTQVGVEKITNKLNLNAPFDKHF